MPTKEVRAPAVATNYEMRSLASLRPYERNPRKHSNKQIRQLRRSIEEFGFTNPLLIDASGMVVAGHGRLEAAKQLGLTEVPTLRLDHLTEKQVRTYVIADNRLAEKSNWDDGLLALELGALLDLDLDFDIHLTGFDTAEVDAYLSPMLDDEEVPVEPDFQRPAVSRLGDLWELAPHRLLSDVSRPRGHSPHAPWMGHRQGPGAREQSSAQRTLGLFGGSSSNRLGGRAVLRMQPAPAAVCAVKASLQAECPAVDAVDLS